MAFEAAAASPTAIPKQPESISAPVAPKATEQSSGIRSRVSSFFKSSGVEAASAPKSPDGILGIKTDDPSEVANVLDYAKAKDSREAAFAARDSRLAKEKVMQDALSDTELAKSYLNGVIDKESKSNGGTGNSIDKHYAQTRVHKAYREKAMNSPDVVAAINSGDQAEVEDAINRTINNTLIAEAKADLAKKIEDQSSPAAGLDELAEAPVITGPDEGTEQPTVSQSVDQGREGAAASPDQQAASPLTLDEQKELKDLREILVPDLDQIARRDELTAREKAAFDQVDQGDPSVPNPSPAEGNAQPVVAEASSPQNPAEEEKIGDGKEEASEAASEEGDDGSGAETEDAGEGEDPSSKVDGGAKAEEDEEPEVADAEVTESPQVQELKSEIDSLRTEISGLKEANGKLVEAVKQVLDAQNEQDPKKKKEMLKNAGSILAVIVAMAGMAVAGVGKEAISQQT